MKRFAPAAERNTDPILAVLAEHLPASGVLLEIASGTGQHALAIAQRFKGWSVQPSEPDPAGRASIEAYRAEAGLDNLASPLDIDVTAASWPISEADAVVCMNMIHISPWAATVGLLDGVGRILSPGGLLYLYGPYLVDGAPTSESNRTFDASLRHRDPAWGIRDMQVVTDEATQRGLTRAAVVPMPANNFSLVFRRAP